MKLDGWEARLDDPTPISLSYPIPILSYPYPILKNKLEGEPMKGRSHLHPLKDHVQMREAEGWE